MKQSVRQPLNPRGKLCPPKNKVPSQIFRLCDGTEMGCYIYERAFLCICVFTRCFFFLSISKKKVLKDSKLVKIQVQEFFFRNYLYICCVAHFGLAHIWSQIGVIKNVVCKTNMILIADALKARKETTFLTFTLQLQ